MKTFKEYSNFALRTAGSDHSVHERMCNWALGLAEAGELQNVVKKYIFHGHRASETWPKVLDECGDVLWYLNALLFEFGMSLEDAAEYNIKKLMARYPEGFSSERSVERDDEDL